METKDKELLLKDLSARLPYGVKAYMKKWSKLDRKYYEGVYTVESVHPSLNDIYGSTENGSVEVILGYSDYDIKPYLFPMSSMTDEQKKELKSLMTKDSYGLLYPTLRYYDYLYKHHIDVRDLIPKGLALDATGLNIY